MGHPSQVVNSHPTKHFCRIHHGFPDDNRLRVNGLDTTIQTGFLNLVIDIAYMDPTPTHIVVVMDCKNAGLGGGWGGGASSLPTQPLTWRHELYPGYKAHRESTPLVIAESADHVRECGLLRGRSVLWKYTTVYPEAESSRLFPD